MQLAAIERTSWAVLVRFVVEFASVTTQRHTVSASIRRVTHRAIHWCMDSLIGQWSHSFVGWLQLSCGIAVLSLPKDVPSFQMVVEVPRVMVASEVAVGCPLAQTTGRVPRGEQPRFLVTLRGDNPRRRSAASHVEHAGPLVNRATGERQHRRQVEPRFHGEGNRRTDLGCCIHLPSVSVDLGQGEAVSQSQQLVATRTSGPRFQRPLARRTTVPSIRLGPGGAGSV